MNSQSLTPLRSASGAIVSNHQSPFPNAYTDSPSLHPNLILGSLQILFWVFLHPSAWRSHVARLDSGLRPDFSLAELSREQWRNPVLRRLLQGYLVWPFVSAVVIGLLSLTTGAPPLLLLLWMGVSVIYGLATSVTVAISVSAAVGIALCIVVGLAAGMAAVIAANNVAFIIVLFVLATGVAGSVAGNLAVRQSAYTLSQQMGGVVVGLIIGIGVIIIATGVAVGATGGTESWLPKAVVNGLIIGIAGGVAGGVAFWVRVRRWRQGVFLGAVTGLTFGLLSEAPVGKMAVSIVLSSLVLSATFALPYLLAERVGGAWAGAVAGALGGGAAAFAVARVGLTQPGLLSLGLLSLPLVLNLAWLVPALLYPLLAAWNLMLLRLDERRAPLRLASGPASTPSAPHSASASRSAPLGQDARRPSLLRLHSAFWNEHQRLPLVGLDEHLVLVAERNPAEGRAAMDYLFNSRQRWAAQAAQIELDARNLARCATADAIHAAHRLLGAGELQGPASALLRSFSRVSQDVEAALKQESAYNQRLALSAVEDRLDGLLRELTRSSERYAVRFRPIAAQWRQIIADHIRALAETVEQRQEIDSPYVIGVPLTEQQEIFVGRTDISAKIEQLLLDRRRPPLLLYGQRRMGKTSLLNNLGRMLPSTIVPLFVDLQGPAARASDHGGFLYNLARGMSDSANRQRNLTLPPLTRDQLAADPFTRFDEWLDEVEAALGQNTALLTLDEFEVLDTAFAKGQFDEAAVLGMLRHLIQHRPRFKVLLAGSHTLDEVQRWASYLINVQVVHLSYLNEAEARQLIERPVKDFALRYEPEASQRTWQLTRGHPFLVQLLCAEIVALKNEQDPSARRLARLADVEAAVPEALSHGSFFFADLERNQVDAAGLAVLRHIAHIAALGEGAVVEAGALAHFPDLDRTLALLLRRDVIESVDGGYRFQVELIRRWFARA
jgi:hypothetical protein